jgi:hypothetical protein
VPGVVPNEPAWPTTCRTSLDSRQARIRARDLKGLPGQPGGSAAGPLVRTGNKVPIQPIRLRYGSPWLGNRPPFDGESECV